jgi:hypothetical protein
MLSLKEFRSLRVLTTDGGSCMSPGGTDSKADIIINNTYSTRVRGFSYPVCSALQRFDIPLLHAVYIEHSMPL